MIGSSVMSASTPASAAALTCGASLSVYGTTLMPSPCARCTNAAVGAPLGETHW
jgi:hypothetical protein